MSKKILLVALLSFVGLQAAEKGVEKPKENITGKILFKGREHYDKRLQKKVDKKKREAERNSSKEIKVYKRQDGSVDSFQTIREDNKQKNY